MIATAESEVRLDQGSPPAPPARIAYFGHDRSDSKVIQRIEGLVGLGFDVLALTFWRDKYNRDHRPSWRNIDLGTTVDYGYGQRVASVLTGLWRAFGARRELRSAGAIVARNLDMAILALLARAAAGGRAPFAYEVLDVHRFLVGERPANRLLRWLERRVLARTDVLIVSSPAYLDAYFRPLQGYRGTVAMLENKVQAQAGGLVRPGGARPARPDGRLVIGWCGTLRCTRSLELLIEIARRHRDQVTVHMRGHPTEIGLDGLLERIAAEPNMVFAGGYRSPDDLAEVYAPIDLNWCLDYYDQGKNSLWLLPNRIYEGGFFDVPALGLAGTAVASKIEQDGLGWVLDEPVVDAFSRLLQTLTPAVLAACRARVAARPDAAFADTGDLERMAEALLDARGFTQTATAR